jgi:hypothetical protein
MSVEVQPEHLEKASQLEKQTQTQLQNQIIVNMLVDRTINLRATNLALEEECDRLREELELLTKAPEVEGAESTD